ncbi:patatin-like phospholipase family protein [Saccharopolyspora shandongensis]|uniref:patatin-like phospholipase family protein n=1 Tax=Saccharopolyspora shandongensis TaxID=418495 RepID=UPI0033F78D37
MKAERIAFVLAGGGARGAYEAGALPILMSALKRHGQRPSMFVGTSVGALNAAYLAASQHLSAAEATAELLGCWRVVGRCSATPSSTTRSWRN